jgi:chitinase
MSKLRKSTLVKILACLLVVILVIPEYGVLAAAKKSVDKQPPTAPQNLIATSVSENSVSLNWSPSVDNVGVSSYRIYKDSTYVASTTSTSYTITGLSSSTAYTFYVKAKDDIGNFSPSSNVITVTTASSTVVVPSVPAKIVAGYYAGWSAYSGYTPLDIQAASLTHINYAFANIGSDLKITLGDSTIDPTNFAKLNELKKTYPNIKTIISVGGWDWSGKFSDVALTDSSRTVFANSVIAFIKQYGFDGVDIDWEYPVAGGLSSNVKRPEDKTNFTLLLQKLRQTLDAQAVVDGKKYILSIAGGAGTSYISNTELNLIANVVDYANVMTYDLHGTWDTYTDFNAPLYTPTESSPQYKLSVDSVVKAWISKGFPASKMVLGVPFYGYLYNGVTNSNNGLYKTFTSGSSITYDKIASTYLSNSSFIKYTHIDAKVPWLFNGSTFISYDDEQSITEKAKYINVNNLAGAVAWELSQNRNGVLVNTLYSNLK